VDYKHMHPIIHDSFWFHFETAFWPRDISNSCRPLFLLNLFFTLSNWLVLRYCSVVTNLKCDSVSVLLVYLHIPSVPITCELLLVRHWQNHASSFIYWRFWAWHEISKQSFSPYHHTGHRIIVIHRISRW